MILLRNEKHTLPLSVKAPTALFGRNQIDTFKGGGGAADLWAVPVIPFAQGMEEVGNIYTPLLKKYRAYAEANRDNTRNKIHGHYIWSLAEIPLTEREVSEAAAACETAVIFIGRFAAEGFDIKDAAGEYRITEAEETMLALVTGHFRRTVLVLNLPGLLDLSFLDRYDVDAILQAFMPGMEAGRALADVLYGKVTPCGKLPDSWAKTAAEYPTNKQFGTDRIVYEEGLYMGYRYFDTFQKEVVYPFGYGLSYTNFAWECVSTGIDHGRVTLEICVTNVGECSGREIVQCYLAVPDGELEQPSQILCGFEKTALLAPGEQETLTIQVNLPDFASYSEKRAAYILEKGTYVLRTGSHSRNTDPVCAVFLEETIACRQVVNRMVPRTVVMLLSKDDRNTGDHGEDAAHYSCAEGDVLPVLVPDFSQLLTSRDQSACEGAESEATGTSLNQSIGAAAALAHCSFADVLAGDSTPQELAARLSDEELAMLLTGDGTRKRKEAGIVPDRPLAVGEGSHTHPVPTLGIPASTMQDGPAGVRASSFANPVPPAEELHGADSVAYPCATLLAATWDRRLVQEIGQAITMDLEYYGFNGLCAPGVNLHRNPRCGRNFEYFSEDPYLSSQMAVSMINGIQKNPDGSSTGYYAVLKHFACNESEDMRLESDSILTERCARELYLRAFEDVIRQAEPLAIMTSYNKINGVYAAAYSDLLDGILRGEWNYTGWVMTDWDVYADPVSCLKAGVDTIMPGRFLSFEQMQEKGLDRTVAQQRAASLIRHLAKTKHYITD